MIEEKILRILEEQIQDTGKYINQCRASGSPLSSIAYENGRKAGLEQAKKIVERERSRTIEIER